jgi:intraflagellar transport protein 172
MFNSNKETWSDGLPTNVDHLYSVTALRWKCDGSKLTTGSLAGAVDLYDACIRRAIYAGKFCTIERFTRNQKN